VSQSGAATDRSGVLVVRVWLVPGGERLLARVTRSLDLSSMTQETSSTDSTAEICGIVRGWLDEFLSTAVPANDGDDR
jgi:hypothetical protein